MYNRILKWLYPPEFVPFIGYLNQWRRKMPDTPALIIPGRDFLTFRKLYQEIDKCRNALSINGVESKSKVAVWLTDPYEIALSHLAVASGAICIPMPKGLTSMEVSGLLRRSNARYLLTDENFPESMEMLLDDLKISKILFSELKMECKSSNTWPEPELDDIAYILQTTGSTAEPKMVPVTHEAISFSCMGTKRSLEITHNDRCLNFLTLTHIHGLMSSFLMPLMAGSSCIFTGSFDKLQFYIWLEELTPTWFSSTPAIFQNIIHKIPGNSQNIRNHSLRFIRSGAAPMSIKLASELENIFGVQLIESYGMTETVHLTGNPVHNRRLGSVGKQVASEIAIFNELNEPCTKGETGSIRVRGKGIMKGYMNNDEANLAAFKNGWFCTGDLGWFDEEGYLYITGREKEMINKGGEKISPQAVEKALLMHPDVAEAVVVSIPHESLGEEVGAVVSLKPDRVLSESDIRLFLGNHVSFHMIPARIALVGELPMSENGKIVRRKVRKALLEQIQTEKTFVDITARTPEENLVAAWFSQILDQPVVNVDMDFFRMGGTSLSAMELITLISKELNESLDIFYLLGATTVRNFASFLKKYYSGALIKLLSSKIEVQEAESGKSYSPVIFPIEYSFVALVLEPQKKFVSSWNGFRYHPESLVIGKNISGTNIPLFWCCQGYEEFHALSEQLGENQPLYGMRSGNLLIKEDPSQVKLLAAVYVEDILKINSYGSIILGGNCQGAEVAWEIAKLLVKQGISIQLLCLMEVYIPEPWSGTIALFYGDDSHLNPYRSMQNPEDEWNKNYGSYTVDIINGKHGTYFREPNLLDFSGKLSRRIARIKSL